MNIVCRIVALGTIVGLSACASTGATFRSGVGDAFLREAPYYAGAGVSDVGTIAYLPITFQRGATQPASFDVSDKPNTPVANLLADMNRYLADSLAAAVRIVAADTSGRVGVPPNVQFGCERQPQDDCEAPNHDFRLRLAVGRPSQDWIAWEQASLNKTNATRLIVITLEIGNYFPRQVNILGKKEIELGTNYSVSAPWLTGLDKPVSVLQLTGAVMDQQGLAVRIGAEGLVAHRTGIVAAGLGMQALITDDDVERARTARRDDMPGNPLVWKIALRNLVGQLSGHPELSFK
jgi:hypothetical protein